MATVLLFLSLISMNSAETANDCVRHRKPWHTLSNHERALFVSAFHTLSRSNVLETFILTHRPAQTGGYNPHKTSENLFWHAYYLYEFESQIRALGGEYECFSMPYWDITVDGEYLANDPDATVSGMPIYNSMLGNDGSKARDYCVTSSPWSLYEYSTSYMCADDEEDDYCCLKRSSGFWSDDTKLFTRSEVNEPVITNKDYRNFDDFGLKLTDIHVNVHNFIGHDAGTHFNTDNGRPPVDPLFVLFHCFLDFVRVLHTDCYDWDTLNVMDLEKHFPNSYKVVYTDMDYVMQFGVLCDVENEGLDVVASPLCMDTDVTVRDIYDSSVNTKWNVLYELGDFWSQNEELQAVCDDNLNSTWFTQNSGSSGSSHSSRKGKILKNAVDTAMPLMSTAYHFGMKHYVLSIVAILTTISVLVLGLCMVKRLRNRYKRMDIMDLFLNEHSPLYNE